MQSASSVTGWQHDPQGHLTEPTARRGLGSLRRGLPDLRRLLGSSSMGADINAALPPDKGSGQAFRPSVPINGSAARTGCRRRSRAGSSRAARRRRFQPTLRSKLAVIADVLHDAHDQSLVRPICSPYCRHCRRATHVRLLRASAAVIVLDDAEVPRRSAWRCASISRSRTIADRSRAPGRAAPWKSRRAGCDARTACRSWYAAHTVATRRSTARRTSPLVIGVVISATLETSTMSLATLLPPE